MRKLSCCTVDGETRYDNNILQTTVMSAQPILDELNNKMMRSPLAKELSRVLSQLADRVMINGGVFESGSVSEILRRIAISVAQMNLGHKSRNNSLIEKD